MSQFNFTQFMDSFRSGEFTHPLISSIKKLSKQQIWMNNSLFGADLKSMFDKNAYDASQVGVFIKLAQNWIRWRVGKVNTQKFEYTQIKNIETVEIKNVQLITDFNGEFVTSLQPDLVLNKYMNLLSPQGEVFLFLGAEYTGFGSGSKIIGKNGTTQTMTQWLRSLPDLNVTFYRGGYAWAGGQWTFVKIKKKKNSIQIPKLEFLGLNQKLDSPDLQMVFQAE